MAKAPLNPDQARIYPEFSALVDYTTDFLFPEIWERPGLSKRDRSLIIVATLIATHRRDNTSSQIRTPNSRSKITAHTVAPRLVPGLSLIEPTFPIWSPRSLSVRLLDLS